MAGTVERGRHRTSALTTAPHRKGWRRGRWQRPRRPSSARWRKRTSLTSSQRCAVLSGSPTDASWSGLVQWRGPILRPRGSPPPHRRGIWGGPGEIRSLYNVDRVRGDTLVIDGWPIGSRYWFDERGAFVRNQALGPWFPGMLGRTLPDGSLILDTYEFGSYGNTLETWAANGPDEDIRPAGVVELVSADGSSVDTLGPILGESWHKTGQLRVNFAMHALPFTPIGLVAWSADHVFIGHTERPRSTSTRSPGRWFGSSAGRRDGRGRRRRSRRLQGRRHVRGPGAPPRSRSPDAGWRRSPTRTRGRPSRR